MIPRIFRARVDRSHHTGAYLVTWLLASGCILCVVIGPCWAAALQETPNASLARTYFLSAHKALAEGDSVSAVQKLKQAIQADSKFAEAYLLLGVAAFRRGDTAKAIEHYQRALQLRPNSYSGHYNLALAYLREHKLEDGRAQLEHAV